MLLNKSFHEVMDVDTGRAWRWPHLHGMQQGLLGLLSMEFLEYVTVSREFRYIHVSG